MPQWLIDLLDRQEAIVAIVGAVSVGFGVPLFNFLAKVVMRNSPPPAPKAYDVRDIPEQPLLLSAKVRLADDEIGELRAIGRDVRAVLDMIRHQDDRIQLLQDRITLLMQRD